MSIGRLLELMRRLRMTFLLVLAGIVVTSVLAPEVHRVVADGATKHVAMAGERNATPEAERDAAALKIGKLRAGAVGAAVTAIALSLFIVFVFVVVADIGANRAGAEGMSRGREGHWGTGWASR